MNVVTAVLQSMRLEAVENNNFDEVVDLLKFGKCVFELPRNSFSVQLKSILKDLYPNESEIPPEVGKMFISADELLNLIEKNDFRDLIKESVKTLFDWITKNLNKDVDLMMSKKRQVDEVAKCLSVLQKSSFFKSVDLQHAVDGFVKHLMMNQLEMDEQNYSIEKESIIRSLIRYLITTFLSQPSCQYCVINGMKTKFLNFHVQALQTTSDLNPRLVENIAVHLMILRECLRKYLETKSFGGTSFSVTNNKPIGFHELADLLGRLKPRLPDYLALLTDCCLNYLGNCVL